MFISLIFANLCRAAESLEYFHDREIRIFSSSANHIFVVHDLDKDVLAYRSRYLNLENIFSAFQISKDSTKYRIMSGNKYIALDKSNNIIFTENSYLWQIKQVKFGYTISHKKQCWTLQTKSLVGISTCTETDDQVFDFRIADEDSKCNSEKRKEQHEVVIKLENQPQFITTKVVDKISDSKKHDTHDIHENLHGNNDFQPEEEPKQTYESSDPKITIIKKKENVSKQLNNDKKGPLFNKRDLGNGKTRTFI